MRLSDAFALLRSAALLWSLVGTPQLVGGTSSTTLKNQMTEIKSRGGSRDIPASSSPALPSRPTGTETYHLQYPSSSLLTPDLEKEVQVVTLYGDPSQEHELVVAMVRDAVAEAIQEEVANGPPSGITSWDQLTGQKESKRLSAILSHLPNREKQRSRTRRLLFGPGCAIVY